MDGAGEVGTTGGTVVGGDGVRGTSSFDEEVLSEHEVICVFIAKKCRVERRMEKTKRDDTGCLLK